MILNDPNVTPEPNDPNYPMIVERNNMLLAACLEIAEPR